MKKKFVLLDIDNTLFNSSSYKEKFFDELVRFLTKEGVNDAHELSDAVYKALRTEKGLFAPEEFVDELVKQAAISNDNKEKILDIIYSKDALEGNLYDEVSDALEELGHIAMLGIFSQGSEKLQRMKLSSIMHFFHENHMHIVTNKEQAIARVFTTYQDDSIFLIDDALPVLHALKKAFPQVVTIWMKRGRYADKQEPIADFTPEKTVLHLSETIEIIKEAN